MTRENTKKMLPIIIAFAEGREIECNAGIKLGWIPFVNKDPSFGYEFIDPTRYRIKESPIKELLLLICAFSEGKVIQHKYDEWIDEDHPLFNDNPENYRIKPEQILIPFTFEDKDLFKDKWIKHKIESTLNKIIRINNTIVGIYPSSFSYNDFLKYFVFEDGSPCGKYINKGL